ncbi:MAG: hypothetical protein BGO07_01935 [Alphaproteobacteria bacterium 40-19]|nr:MAG: hypothetical protein BGO07_01935 [Alphaproteobacteria bacterium 40-19]
MKDDQVCPANDPAFKLIYEKVICPYQFPASLFNKIELEGEENFPVLKKSNSVLNSLELKEGYRIQYVPDTLASMAVISGVYQIKMEKVKKDLEEAWRIPEIVYKGLGKQKDLYKICLEIAEKSLPVYELLHECLAKKDNDDKNKKILYKKQTQIKEADWVGIYSRLQKEIHNFEKNNNYENQVHEQYSYQQKRQEITRSYVASSGELNPEQRVRAVKPFVKKDFFKSSIGSIFTLEKNAEEKGKAVLFRSVERTSGKTLEDLNVEGVCRSLSFGSLFQGFLSEPNNPNSNCPLDRHIEDNKERILYALPLALNDQDAWKAFFVDPIPVWMQPFGYLEMHSRTRVPVEKDGVPLLQLDDKQGKYGMEFALIPQRYQICAQPPLCISEEEDLGKNANQVVKLLKDKAHLVWGDKKNFESSKATMTVENVEALKGIRIGKDIKSPECEIF